MTNKLLPRGLRNNNPGNVVKSNAAWKGKTQGKDPKFETFETMEDGIAVIFKLLIHYIVKDKLVTIKEIISKWAPSNENNTKTYIDHVCTIAGKTATQIIRPAFEELEPIVRGICIHENGGDFIPEESFAMAWHEVRP